MADKRRLIMVAGVAPVLLAVLAVLIAAVLAEPPSSTAAVEAPGRFKVYDEPQPLPAIRFRGPEGDTLTLADFRGRVVLLNVWATWCPPCREEMPSLDRLQAKLGGSEFVVVPVSVDREGRIMVEAFYANNDIDQLGIYLNPANDITAALGAFGIPMTLLIDRYGREIGRMMGGMDWDTEAMVRFLRSYIGKG